MKFGSSLLFFLSTILIFNTACAVAIPDNEYFKDQIVNLNTQIDKHFRAKDVNSLIDLYHEEITYCAEYKPAIFYKGQLKKFYVDWWQINSINRYQKSIYEVQSFGDHILEDGHFTLEYQDEDGSNEIYKGKYFVIWKNDSEGNLSILSEGFCSDEYRQASEMPYSDVKVEEEVNYPQNPISKSLSKLIQEANDDLIRIVEAGDSEARIKGFTNDAIYLHHFEEIIDDPAVLKAYLRKTYRPEAEIYVEHTLGRCYDLGNGYSLVHGHYKGGWKANGGGTFEGNFLKIHRLEDGVLKTYRSWTNNDR